MGSTIVSQVPNVQSVSADDSASSLLTQISKQTAASQPLQPSPQVYTPSAIVPEPDPTIESMSRIGVWHQVPENGRASPLREIRLLAQIPKYAEPVGLLLSNRYKIGLGAVMVNIRNGLALTRRWNPKGEGIVSAEGHALSVTLHCDRVIRQQITLMIFVLYHRSYVPKLSIRLNINLSSAVPSNNPAFTAIRSGDVDHLKQIPGERHQQH